MATPQQPPDDQQGRAEPPPQSLPVLHYRQRGLLNPKSPFYVPPSVTTGFGCLYAFLASLISFVLMGQWNESRTMFFLIPSLLLGLPFLIALSRIKWWYFALGMGIVFGVIGLIFGICAMMWRGL